MVFSDKLVALLRTFSKYELNRFRKFLASPYYNEQDALVALFEAINTALRKGDNAVMQLDKVTAWRAMFRDKPLDEAQLRRSASELQGLALQFLAAEARQNQPLADALTLQSALGRPDLQKHLSSVERQIQVHLEGQTRRDLEHYWQYYRYELALSGQFSKKMTTAEYVERLLAADHHLDCFYLIQKLKFYLGWLTFKDLRVTDKTFELIDGLATYLDRPELASVPLLQLYRRAVYCLQHPSEEAHFHEFLALLTEHTHLLAQEDLRECYQIAQNYCAFKVNQGRTDYYPTFFGIFKTVIEQGLLLDGQVLPEGTFKNIITISLRVGEFEWAERFINEYAPHLPPNIRENARMFNLANLYSHQKQYGKVIELLRNVEYSDVVYSLGAKLVLLRTYYESAEWLAMDSLIESFKIYLRRNQLISKTLKVEYLNFLNALGRLPNILYGDMQALERLKQKVLQTERITSKKWLLEKITELEQGQNRRKVS
jgi:hypothetical protein